MQRHTVGRNAWFLVIFERFLKNAHFFHKKVCFPKMSHYFKKTASIPRVSSNNTSSEQILACEFTFLLSNLTLQNLVVFIFFEHKKWQSTKFCRVRFGSKNLNLKVKLGLIDVLLIETLGIWVVFAILIHILFQEAY